MRRIVVLAAMGLSLSACFDEPRLKADTESNFKNSLATINKSLSIDDNEKLDSALKDIVLVQTDAYGPLSEATVYRAAAEKLGVPPNDQSIALFMHAFRPAFETGFATNWVGNRAAFVVKYARYLVEGRSAKEILGIAQGERKRAAGLALAIYRGQLEKAKSALDRVQAEAEDVTRSEAKAKGLLGQIQIGAARFRLQNSKLQDEPMISFTIANNSTVAVKRIFVDGMLQIPGRSVPWARGTFDYELRGGLEAGKSRALNVTSSLFSRWSSVSHDITDGAVLLLDLKAFDDTLGNRVGHNPERRDDLTKRRTALERGVRELESKIGEQEGDPDRVAGPDRITEPPLANGHTIQADSETLRDVSISVPAVWSITESRSPRDGSPQILGTLASTDGSAWLGLRCEEKKTEAYVNTSSLLGVRDMRRVIYRLDEGKPFDVRWAPSITGNRVFSPSGIAFIKSLPDKGKLFFRVFGFDGTPIDATFELVSGAELKNKIALACRWSEDVTAQPHSQPTSRSSTQAMDRSGVKLGIHPLPLAQAIAAGVKTDAPSGLYVGSVDTNEAAARAGIVDSDVILAFAGKPINTVDDLRSALRGTTPRTSVTLTVWRKGGERKVKVKFRQ
jgi:PDZ domain-containing protein